MESIHIVPYKDRWAARRPHSKRVSAVYNIQGLAFEEFRKRLQKSGGELILHGKDGKIREKNTYGKKDPFPPEG